MISAVLAPALGADRETNNPWTEVLAENRQKWQKKVNFRTFKVNLLYLINFFSLKADEGERGIDTSDAINDPKPPRVNAGISRRNSSLPIQMKTNNEK